MNEQMLREATELAEKVGHVFVATCDPNGIPHMAAAGKLYGTDHDHLAVGAWFCPGTVVNLRDNRRVSVVVWDATADKGYQLLGEVTEVADLGVPNGRTPATDTVSPSGQGEMQLTVHVDRVMHFTHAPHSDTEQ